MSLNNHEGADQNDTSLGLNCRLQPAALDHVGPRPICSHNQKNNDQFNSIYGLRFLPMEHATGAYASSFKLSRKSLEKRSRKPVLQSEDTTFRALESEPSLVNNFKTGCVAAARQFPNIS